MMHFQFQKVSFIKDLDLKVSFSMPPQTCQRRKARKLLPNLSAAPRTQAIEEAELHQGFFTFLFMIHIEFQSP